MALSRAKTNSVPCALIIVLPLFNTVMPKFTKVQLAVFLRKKKDEEDMIEAQEAAELADAAADAEEEDRASRNRAMIHAFHEERRRRIRAERELKEREERLFFNRMDELSESPRINRFKEAVRTRYAYLYRPSRLKEKFDK